MEQYSEDSIVVLPELEAVRRRPGMYVGGLGSAGLHHMVWEIVGNAVDEHLRGHASYVRVEIDGDAISVEDDGRGIPVESCPQDPAKSMLEVYLTTLHGSVAFRPDHVHVAPGLIGVGAAIVSALSERLDVDVWRGGRHHHQSYARGVALGPVRDLGPARRTGTRMTFRPDFTIFQPCTWRRARIKRRLREIAAMCSTFTTILDNTAMRCPDGLADHVRYLGRRARPLCAPVRIVGSQDGVDVEVALLWTDAPRSCVRGFVGTGPTPTGTHVEGLAQGMLGALVALDPARFATVYPAAFAELIEQGMMAAINVMLRDPRFGNPCRDQLVNPEVRDIVSALVTTELHARLVADGELRDMLLARMPRRAATAYDRKQ